MKRNDSKNIGLGQQARKGKPSSADLQTLGLENNHFMKRDSEEKIGLGQVAQNWKYRFHTKV